MYNIVIVKFSQTELGGEMMNMTEIIESYLKGVFKQLDTDTIEIKRSELAKKFSCVPSQVNYVMKTKFTFERGYIVESKRGGGGYIRIQKIGYMDAYETMEQILSNISDHITQAQAQDFIVQLLENKCITEREAKMMIQMMRSDVLLFESAEQEAMLRARLLRILLKSLY